jgi:hypothetical protein
VYKYTINTAVLCSEAQRVNPKSGALFVAREAIKLKDEKKCHQK